MATMQAIEGFLDQKRVAVVGVSHQSNDFSRTLFRELQKQGYDAVPVNPRAEEIEGRHCFARMQDVQPAVEAALLMTSATVTESVVRDCIASGVKHIWLYRAVGEGAVTPGAVQLCLENGISVVPGECPMMFLPKATWPHRLHGFIKRITGSYPR